MATTTKTKFRKVRLFKVTRELNVSTEKIKGFLEENDYMEALSGRGLNASITDEEAYLALKHEFASDAEAAERLRELRAEKDETEAPDREKVANLEGDGAPPAGELEEETLEAEAPDAAVAEEPEEAAAEDEASAEAQAQEEEPPAEAKVDDEAAAEEATAAEAEPSTAEEESGAAAEAAAEAPPADDAAAEEAEAAQMEAVAEAEAPTDADEASAEATSEETAEEAPAAEAAEVAEATEEEAAPEAQETADAEADEEEALAEGASDDEEAADEEDPDATLKADRYRLPGASVVGKMDLSKFKKRKRKRKRKRKAKQDKKQNKRSRKNKKKRKKKRKPDEKDVEETMQETLRELEQGASRARQRRRQRRRQRHAREREMERERAMERENLLRVTEYVSTGELAGLMGEKVNDLISTLFDAGLMVSINQRLDADTISFVADEYGYEVDFTTDFGAEDIEIEEDRPEDLRPRAPVVTVMGHVDHGKTSLLDYVRKDNVVAGEAGGITQHIGAYKVTIGSGNEITFLDTPGHEAFTAMRARGAKATDVVILVVAADDAVMPQTREAINHAQAADVPLVVAINKMDLPDADEQRVMQQLSEEGILVEQYGGEVQCALVSAETGEGIDDLLEKVVLEAELRELTANPERVGSGVVIESYLDKGRGNVVTTLIQNGTLRVGDAFVAGVHSGRVRAMFDERDRRIDKVGPSEPALILGSNGAPEVGDQFVVFEDESEARDIAQQRQQIYREQRLRQKSQITLDEISRRLALGEFHELNLVIKADVSGSVEALSDALMNLSTETVSVNIVHSGAGAITESDIMLATASEAVIIGFQVRPTGGARALAKQEEVDVRTYSIIYDAIEDVHDALEGLLTPGEREETLGSAEVRQLFRVPSVGTVAGCRVTEGRIQRNDDIRVVRDGVVVYEGGISSLKHHEDDVREIQSGYECGLSVANFNDIKVGDELETYRVVEVKRTLEEAA